MVVYAPCLALTSVRCCISCSNIYITYNHCKPRKKGHLTCLKMQNIPWMLTLQFLIQLNTFFHLQSKAHPSSCDNYWTENMPWWKTCAYTFLCQKHNIQQTYAYVKYSQPHTFWEMKEPKSWWHGIFCVCSFLAILPPYFPQILFNSHSENLKFTVTWRHLASPRTWWVPYFVHPFGLFISLMDPKGFLRFSFLYTFPSTLETHMLHHYPFDGRKLTGRNSLLSLSVLLSSKKWAVGWCKALPSLGDCALYLILKGFVAWWYQPRVKQRSFDNLMLILKCSHHTLHKHTQGYIFWEPLNFE